jgi:hypothetical protein
MFRRTRLWVIDFNGTMEQWNAIVAEDFWRHVHNDKVYCADGIIYRN